jgi:Protein of unknown function (DUF1552)
MQTRTYPVLSRRTFLRASGVALALPLLDAMRARAVGAQVAPRPKRMICICTALGMHAPLFFPTGAGRDYKESPYLESLKDHREDYTVFSGFAHPGNEAGGHNAERTFLSAAVHPELAGFRNSISLDQFVAEKLATATRFPSLTLANTTSLAQSLAVNRGGVNLPSESKPSKVFARLFLEGSPDEVKREQARLAEGRSVLDAVSDQAKQLSRQVGAADSAKLDEYFTSVREMEQRLQAMQAWSRKPKPKVSMTPPQDVRNNADMIGKMDALFNLMPLALATDSTRVITLFIGESGVPPIPGVSMGDHALSHHGQEPEKIAQLRLIEQAKMKSVAGLIAKLKTTQEGGESFLRNTSVLFGSNLGNASNHSTNNLPILLAGGGFKHGQHLVVAPKGDLKNSAPLSNLFVSILQRMGVETDKFGTSTGALSALESA